MYSVWSEVLLNLSSNNTEYLLILLSYFSYGTELSKINFPLETIKKNLI